MNETPPNAKKKQPSPPCPEKVPDGDKTYGLGTDIANLFTGIGFRPGEEIKEWKGFAVKDPFDS